MTSTPKAVTSRWLEGALACALAGTALALYARTVHPSLGGMYNSEEYQYTAYSMSLAHSTGYPLYLLLGKMWVTLLPIGSIAYRMNLFSVFWAALAVVLVFALVTYLARSRTAGLVAGLILATNDAFWRYASVAEVDTLTVFLAACIFLALLLWREGRVPLELGAFLYGLALAHHRSSLFYAPGILVFVWLSRPGIFRQPVRLLRVAALVALPLLVYLYAPLRAQTEPGYVHDLNSLLNYWIGASTVSQSEFRGAPEDLLGRADLIYHTYFWNWFTGWGLLLALWGWFGWKGARLPRVDAAAVRWLFLPPFVILTLFTLPAHAGDIDRYLLVPVMVAAIGCGLGLARLWQWAAGLDRPLARGAMALAVLALGLQIPIASISQTLSSDAAQGNSAQNWKVYRFWDEAMDLPLEQGAFIIGNWSELNAIKYMQRVEGRRPDLRSVGTSLSAQETARRIGESLQTGQPVYVTPGDPIPAEEFAYTAVGSLLRVSREPNRTAPQPVVALGRPLGPLTLLGYGISTRARVGVESARVQLQPDESARLGLYWRADQTPSMDYQVQLRLLDSAGHSLWQVIDRPLRDFYPTSQWEGGSFVTTMHSIYVPPGTPPSAYSVEVALVDPGAKKVLEPRLVLSTLQVSRPPQPQVEAVFVKTKRPVVFGPLEFLGLSGADLAAAPNGRFDLAVAWHAREALSADYRLQFSLVDARGEVWQQFSTPPVRDLPTSRWLKDDAFKEYYTIPVAANAPQGASSLRLQVLDAAGQTVAPSSGGSDILLFQVTIKP